MAPRKLSEHEKYMRRLAKARMSTPKKKSLLGRFASGLKALATGTRKQQKATEFAASQARKRNKAKQNLEQQKHMNKYRRVTEGSIKAGMLPDTKKTRDSWKKTDRKMAYHDTEANLQYHEAQLRKKKKPDSR